MICGVLPPVTHLVYAADAVVDTSMHALNKAYLLACGLWLHYIAKADMDKTFSEMGVVGPFVGGSERKSGGDFWSDILWACAFGPNNCLYPMHDKVVFLTQAQYNDLYQVMAEVRPHVTLFLDGILLEGEDTKENNTTSPFSFDFGCNDTGLQWRLLGLVGIDDPSLFIGSGHVFARVAIVLTAGHSLAPLLNYWELTSLQRRVERLQGIAPPGPLRLALVLVWDTGVRRCDADCLMIDSWRACGRG